MPKQLQRSLRLTEFVLRRGELSIFRALADDLHADNLSKTVQKPWYQEVPGILCFLLNLARTLHYKSFQMDPVALRHRMSKYKLEVWRIEGKVPLVLLLLLLTAGLAFAGVIPDDRRIDWSTNTVGVLGGIPKRSTIFTNAALAGCDLSGKSDCSLILNSLLAACPSNQVVYLPSGYYLCAHPITPPFSRHFTLRGDGMGKTVIIDGVTNGTPQALIFIGVNSISGGVPITSGYAQGSSNIVVSTAAGFAAHQMVYLYQGDISYVHNTGGSTNVLRYPTLITAVNGNTLSIWPPLCFSFSLNFGPSAKAYNYSTTGCGVESLTVTHINPITKVIGTCASSICMDQCYGCWITNVESSFSTSTHLYVFDCLRCELSHNYVHDATSYGPDGGPGIELYAQCSGMLIQDNTAANCFPSFMLSSGSSGNVVCYNFSTNVNSGTDIIGADFDCNHGAHNVMNLFEGNVGGKFQSDGYFGSASHSTLFRNYFSGTHPTLKNLRVAVDLTHWSDYFNLVGNVLGTPGWNGGFTTETNSYPYSWATIYRLGYPYMGNTGYSGASTNPPTYNKGALDYNVKATLYTYFNFDYFHNAVPDGSSNALPSSLFYSAKPGWWGSLPWPAIGPDLSPMVGAIPAQARYGEMASGAKPPQAPSGLRVAPEQ